MAVTFRTRPLAPHLARTLSTSTRTTTTGVRIAAATARPGRAPSPISPRPRPQRSQFHQSHSRSRLFENNTNTQPTTSNVGQHTGAITAKFINFQQPNTFISPPLHRHLSRPRTLLRLLWIRLVQHAKDQVGLWGYGFSAKTKIFSRSPFKINRGALVPAAKALHATMSDALARGDKKVLEDTCVEVLGQSLVSRVEGLRQRQAEKYPGLKRQLLALARQTGVPRGAEERLLPLFKWSLVKYTKPWAYPRIVDHKLTMMPITARQQLVIRQAVVAIASRQRLAEVRPAGVVDGRMKVEEVEGSVREMDLVEYVTIVAMVNEKTQKTGEWMLLGTGEETTLKSWADQARLVAELVREGGGVVTNTGVI